MSGKAAALGVPRKGVLGIKVLLRAGVCRPREELARSITSLAPALTLSTPCRCSLLTKLHMLLGIELGLGHMQAKRCVWE